MGRTLRYTYYRDDLPKQTIASQVRLNDSTTPRDVVLSNSVYDAAGNLTTLTTGAGKTRTDYTYDAAGRVTARILDPATLARRTDYTVDNEANPTRVVRSAAGTTRTETADLVYDDAGRLTRQTVENGATDLVRTWTRDKRGLVTTTVDPRGNTSGANAAAYTTSFGYDVLGRLVEQSDPTANVERNGAAPVSTRPVHRLGYDTFGATTHDHDPEGRVIVRTYDRDGRNTRVTHPSYTPPSGGTAITPQLVTTFDAAGRVTKVKDPRGNERTFTYDQLGRVTKVVDPPRPGQTTGAAGRFEYDLAGEQTAQVDQTGARVEATYDDLGRQVTSTVVERRPSAAALTTKLGYDDSGSLTSTTSPLGFGTVYTRNAADEVTAVRDPLNHTTSLTYDLAGRPAATIDPLGNVTATEYDQAGRLTVSRDHDASWAELRRTSYGYDSAGNLTSVTPPRGYATQRVFDAGNRVISTTEPVSATDSITTTFGYDAAGARTRLTDGRNNSTYTTYNSLGLVQTVVEPATSTHPAATDRTWTTSYDANGNPVIDAAPGGVSVTRTFDALNDLTAQTGTGASAATTATAVGYDAAGRITSLNTPGGTIAATYNDRGSLLSTTAPNGNSSFTYDNDGRLTQQTDRAGTAGYGYDSASRLTSATDPVTGRALTLGYDNDDRLTGITYGTGGPTRTIGYDPMDRPTSDVVKNAAGTTLTSIGYGYDLDDNLTSKTTAGVPVAGQHTYGYDRAGRLTSWTAPGNTVTGYTWDKAGNRTGAGPATFTYDERNRLTSGGGTTYTYTPRGTLATQTTGGVTTALSFDAFDRLISDGGSTYAYDGLDRLASRTSGGATTSFAYGGGENDVVATLNAAGTVASKYSRMPSGAPLGVGEGSSSTLALADLHSDVYGLLNPASGGTLAGTASYSPFGEATYGGATRSGLGYQGEWTDPTTGRVNMHARWYTPGTGGFTSRDSWTLAPEPSVQANRYGYGNANPFSGTDPSGHVWGDDACVYEGVGCAVGQPNPRGGDPGRVGCDDCQGVYKPVIRQPTPQPRKPARDRHSTSGGSNHSASRGTTSGGGARQTPPEPKVDPRKAIIRNIAMTPQPRLPSVPALSQAQIDRQRNLIESKQRPVAAEQMLNDVVMDYVPQEARTAPVPDLGLTLSPVSAPMDPRYEQFLIRSQAFGGDYLGLPNPYEIEIACSVGYSEACAEIHERSANDRGQAFALGVLGVTDFANCVEKSSSSDCGLAVLGVFAFGKPFKLFRGTRASDRVPWTSWENYPKVRVDGQEFAQIGKRLYSQHAVDRMQPSGMRYSPRPGPYEGGKTGGMPQLRRAGGDHGRSVSPSFVEDVISRTRGVRQENGNFMHDGGGLQVILSPEGRVVTVMTN
jgi:RHS repeat-associated protein